MTKVLQVSYGFGFGGIRAMIMNYMSHLDRDEFQMDIYAYGCSESPFTQQVEEMGGNIYFDPINHMDGNHYIRFTWVLYKFIKAGHYDVVHAHCNLISAWVTLAARMAGVPVRISHSHCASHLNGRFVHDWWCRLRRVIISLTATHRLACGREAGIAMYGEGKKFLVINNGIDVGRFAHVDTQVQKALQAEFCIPADHKVYANVTRMDPPKNQLFAIKVFAEILKLDSKSVLIIGGVNPVMNSTETLLREEVNRLGIDENVRFTSARMDIEQLYHFTDCWLYTSIYEGLPFGPIELQAASVPCLVSDVITNEIDLGLGLIEFLSLDAPPRVWAEEAIIMNKEYIPFERTLEAFQEHNFDITANADRLAQIYRVNKI